MKPNGRVWELGHRLRWLTLLVCAGLLASCATTAPTPAPTDTPVPSPTPKPAPDPALVEAAAQVCNTTRDSSVRLHPDRMNLAESTLTLLLRRNEAGSGWVWAGEQFDLPNAEAAPSATLRTLICIRETTSQTGRYSNGQPAYTRNWEVHMVSWPEGQLLNTTTLESPPPSEVEGLTVGVGEAPVEQLFAWAAQPPDGRNLPVWERQMRQPIQTVAVSPDGSRLAFGLADGQVRTFEAATGREFPALSREEPLEGTGSTTFWGPLRLAEDGATLYSVSAAGVTAWDVAAGQARQHWGLPFPPEEAGGRPTEFRFLEGGRIVAITTSPAGVIQVWDVAAGQALKTLVGPREITSTTSFWPYISPDLNTVAIVEYPEAELSLWDLDTGQRVRELKSPADPHSIQVLFSPDGLQLAALEGPRVVFWKIATGEASATIQAEGFDFDRASFSPDGRFLAGCDRSSDYALKVWDSRTAEARLTTTAWNCQYQFLQDGRTLALAQDTGWLGYWDIPDGQKTRLLSMPGLDTSLLALPGGRIVVFWDRFGAVQVRDVLDND